MMRDLTMIFSVLLSVVSVSFGLYKNFEARNNRAFIYEQAYRIIGRIQEASIPPAAKSQLTEQALGALGTPLPVLDLSRSSADVATQDQACSEQKKTQCAALATDLATANAACARGKGTAWADCARADQARAAITEQGCFVCYTH